jgi:hypothetical protein
VKSADKVYNVKFRTAAFAAECAQKKERRKIAAPK